MNITYQFLGTIILGFVLLLFGLPLYKLSLRVAGFILGLVIGIVIFGIIIKFFPQFKYAQLVIIAGGILVAILSTGLLHKYLKVLLFLAGFIIGTIFLHTYFSGNQFYVSYDLNQIIEIFKNISPKEAIGGLVFGILSFLLEKIFVIIFTCYWGATLLSSNIKYKYAFPVAFLIGVFFQALFFLKRKSKKLKLKASGTK